MVIGLLTITSIPTITGVAEAISAQKKQNASSKEQEKFNLTAMLARDEDDDSTQGKWKETGFCVLKDGKAWLDLPGAPAKGHRFCGFYFKYPGDEGHLGLVSTASDDTPMLNWIYVNAETGRLEHGSRKDTLGHVIGPWGWSEDEAFLTLRGRRGGFVARREESIDDDGGAEGRGEEERWGVYWDPEQKLLAAEEDDEDEDGVETCQPMLLRRRPLLGMESKYVRDEDS
ncbi:hypothetical protein VFPFJ_05066 [Purpureocillium lilacinum]|uniref:Uncharacterized protein n=2 Tax=Purpureocillium lilacinum TaxID=33203 RepID=A0A179H1J4_PURLI|nr:hypothetical protein VFPFJ_05066 [Purpureocillium lilacinum]OAQ84117.1 hypothetical protein VFPBJ_02885 [Purpureocillium lilacinum]OAQ90907.1 hypothetical protein VFPFJ_05066 [Purpureocillium lilacinum]GJN77900.1 hypothetical protein PLIIFM63780_001393 [Purpureocillium lilacinum]